MARKKKASIFEGRMEKEEVAPEKEEFLEPEEHEAALDAETPEDVELSMHLGEKTPDVYTEEGREELEEADELGGIGKYEEEGTQELFTEGSEERGELGECACCGKILPQDFNKVVEREFEHELFWFCSNACAEKGPKKR